MPPAIYRLKVTLRHVRPPIWRTLEVLASLSLLDVHRIIQAAMGWTNTHLHQFLHRGVYYGPTGGELGERMTSERRTRLSDLLEQPGDSVSYEYDFGDGWEHEVRLETIESAAPGLKYPRVIAGKRACPPEDVGGPPGYAAFLEAIANPGHENHATLLAWVGAAFDPEAFDIVAANDAIPVRRKAY